MRGLIVSIFCLTVFIGKSQVDTVRLMQYNLLNYGNFTSYCDSTNNDINAKDDYLATILDYLQPDVLTVNELGVEFVGLENKYGKQILDNTLNINGVTKYQKAAHTGGPYLVNMLYYNTEKLVFYKQEILAYDSAGGNLVREVDFYTLYHNDPNLAIHNDTVFMTFVVAHLKAGSNQSDKNERSSAAYGTMKYIEDYHNFKGNRFLCGDLNCKGDDELGFSHFLDYPIANLRFKDPIDKPGYWAGDWQFEDIHTQSTHTNSGCPAAGGLDDRFDFILATDPVITGGHGVSYIANTYKAVGNDGSSFNTDLNTSTNSGVPPSVASALYNMSDHLPIVMDIKVSKDLISGIYQPEIEKLNIEYNNPVQSELVVRVPNDAEVEFIELYDIEGRLAYSNANPNATQFIINTGSLTTGLYFLKIQTIDGLQGNYKVVKW